MPELRPKIVVVSPNFALDNVVAVAHITAGAILRASSEHVSGGGKGVNVARALRSYGEEAEVFGIVAGAVGTSIRKLIEDEGLKIRVVEVSGESRIATIIVQADDSEKALVINGPGPALLTGQWDAYRDLVITALGAASPEAVICTGSLPPTVAADGYNDILDYARELGAYTVVDASGDILAAALETSPCLVKVNLDEATKALRHAAGPRTVSSVADALDGLQQLGAESAIVTLGKDGAAASHGGSRKAGHVDGVSVVHTTGAGDAFLAGFLRGHLRGNDFFDAFGDALAAGSASCETQEPGRLDVARAAELRSTLQTRVL